MDGSAFNAALVELLGRTEGPAALRALLDALQYTQGDGQAALLRVLLNRDDSDSAAHVAKLLPILDSPARALLCAEPALLEGLARAALKDVDPAVRLHVIELLADAGQPTCAYLLADGASDSTGAVRSRSAEALLALVRDFQHAKSVLDKHAAPAVAQAVRAFVLHQDVRVLQAAILLGPSCSPELLEDLATPANRLSGPLEAALRGLQSEEAAGFVMAALRHRGLAAAAQSYLAQADWPTLAAIGTAEHWLAVAAVRRAAAEIKALRAVAEDMAGLNELPASQQAPALRLVLACGIDAHLKDSLLGLALAGEPAVALAAMPYLLQRLPARAELGLMALHSRCGDAQAVAAACILAGGVDGNLTEHLLEVLPRLAEPVRGVTRQYLAADAFDRFWRSYRKLAPQVRGRAGRALLKLDGRVAELLAGRLASQDPAQQLQAAQMVQQLGMVTRYESALCRLARRGNGTVRAVATTALGEGVSFRARSTLAGCLDDPDRRVQANAIEALAQAGADASAVRDKLASENNRVRANAIRWLLAVRDSQADMALAAMLTDNRSAHRISALWVVKTLQYSPAAGILDRLAIADGDAKVRARAATVLRGLSGARLSVPAGRGNHLT